MFKPSSRRPDRPRRCAGRRSPTHTRSCTLPPMQRDWTRSPIATWISCCAPRASCRSTGPRSALSATWRLLSMCLFAEARSRPYTSRRGSTLPSPQGSSPRPPPFFSHTRRLEDRLRPRCWTQISPWTACRCTPWPMTASHCFGAGFRFSPDVGWLSYPVPDVAFLHAQRRTCMTASYFARDLRSGISPRHGCSRWKRPSISQVRGDGAISIPISRCTGRPHNVTGLSWKRGIPPASIFSSTAN